MPELFDSLTKIFEEAREIKSCEDVNQIDKNLQKIHQAIEQIDSFKEGIALIWDDFGYKEVKILHKMLAASKSFLEDMKTHARYNQESIAVDEKLIILAQSVKDFVYVIEDILTFIELSEEEDSQENTSEKTKKLLQKLSNNDQIEEINTEWIQNILAKNRTK